VTNLEAYQQQEIQAPAPAANQQIRDPSWHIIILLIHPEKIQAASRW
jgi:hypothetical protein